MSDFMNNTQRDEQEAGLPTAENPLNIEPTPVPAQKSIGAKIRSLLKETLQTIFLAVVLYLVIDAVIARVRVENISMVPTLNPGEFLIVNKLSYKFGPVQRGDIVVFHYPNDPREDYIKRVIGVPGDTVAIIDSNVFVNSHKIQEPYIANGYSFESGEWQVPPGSLFVLGDNRKHSSDSQEWGFVPLENVVGKALMRYWPLNRIENLSRAYPVRAANWLFYFFKSGI